MVKIRLSRGGAKKRPFFPIVVTDSRTARDGEGIERLGFFNPIAKGGEERLRLNLERLNLWVQRGAQISARVSSLVKEMKAGPEAVAIKRAAKSARLKISRANKKAASTVTAPIAVTADNVSSAAPAEL